MASRHRWPIDTLQVVEIRINQGAPPDHFFCTPLNYFPMQPGSSFFPADLISKECLHWRYSVYTWVSRVPTQQFSSHYIPLYIYIYGFCGFTKDFWTDFATPWLNLVGISHFFMGWTWGRAGGPSGGGSRYLSPSVAYAQGREKQKHPRYAWGCLGICSPWLCQNSFWKWPFTVDLLWKQGDFTVHKLFVYQRVAEICCNHQDWWVDCKEKHMKHHMQETSCFFPTDEVWDL